MRNVLVAIYWPMHVLADSAWTRQVLANKFFAKYPRMRDGVNAILQARRDLRWSMQKLGK